MPDSTAASRLATPARRFRALWVFRQALVSLGASPDQSSLLAIHGRLRELTARPDDHAIAVLCDDIEALAAELLAADAAIPPAQLRHFLQRVASYDDTVLQQLAEVYLTGHRSDWSSDRRDKLGFVLTRLGERIRSADPSGPHRTGASLDGRQRLRDRCAWVWERCGAPPATAAEVETACRQIAVLQAELAATTSLGELHARGVIPRYRGVKDELGDLLFQPDVLAAVVETNLALKSTVHALFRRDEPRIFADSELVLELEADLTVPPDDALRAELERFHAEVRRFEAQLRADDLKLESAAELHGMARDLLQRISDRTPT